MVANTSAGKGGRPARPDWTRAELDAALAELGRHYYASRAVDALRDKLKIGKNAAYELVEAARAELRRTLAGDDPITALWLGLTALAFDPEVKPAVRVQALNGCGRLLGYKALAGMIDDDEALKLLREIGIRQRTATRNQDPNEVTQ